VSATNSHHQVDDLVESIVTTTVSDIAAPTADLPGSTGRFADGATHRIEIPSVEGPRCVEAVLDAAKHHNVPVVRLSQGTGSVLLTDSEIRDMVAMTEDAGVELCLFVRPCGAWDASAASRATAGPVFGTATWGDAQLRASLKEMARMASLGVRSVLVGDVGLLAMFGRMRAAGHLPAAMRAKTSVMLVAANAATAALYTDLGADTINVAPDLSVADIAALRRTVDTPLDVYIEAPDDIGGFVRYHELAEIVRLAAPVYVKLGVRNAPNIYPSGGHLDATAIALAVERVRRARIALDILDRAGLNDRSVPGAPGLGIPVTARR
jgi:hypothetical protein